MPGPKIVGTIILMSKVKEHENKSIIHFEAKLSKVGSTTLLRLPKGASAKLPSRGMAMVEGTINGHPFQAPLEPDGVGSHWFKVDPGLSKVIKADEGDTVKLAIEPVKEWSEPKVPADLKKALAEFPQAQSLWADITPMARWDWVRWVSGTKNPETRKKRIGVALSKLKAGNRRPCCFDRTSCTVSDVSSNGVLLDSSSLRGRSPKQSPAMSYEIASHLLPSGAYGSARNDE
jgi:hypothetical protein